jgi:hypothetical protein
MSSRTKMTIDNNTCTCHDLIAFSSHTIKPALTSGFPLSIVFVRGWGGMVEPEHRWRWTMSFLDFVCVCVCGQENGFG